MLPCEPEVVVACAQRREALRGTLCNRLNTVRLPDHLLWPQTIELRDTRVIRSPHPVVCPGYLQTKVITIGRLKVN
jgi:hypothetical protein